MDLLFTAGRATQDPDEDSPPDTGKIREKQKRNRKAISCAQCRKRKLKCDRKNPCSSCTERDEADQCDWSNAIRPPAAPAPSADKGTEMNQFKAYLDRLGTLVDQLEGQSSSASQASHSNSSLFPVQHQQSGLVPQSQVEFDGMLETPQVSDSPCAILPLAWQQIMQHYFLNHVFNVQIHQPVLFVNSRSAMLVEQQFSLANPDNWLTATLLALMVAIAQSEGSPIPPAAQVPGVSSDLLVQKAADWLDRSRQLRSSASATPYEVLCDEARVLYLMYHYKRFRQPVIAAGHLSTAISIAFHAGVHIDPNPLDTCGSSEERRLLWSALVRADTLHSPINRYTISAQHYSTPVHKLPIEDPASLLHQPQPVDSHDSRLRCYLQSRLAEVSRQITDQVYACNANPSLADINALHQQIERIETEFEDKLNIVNATSRLPFPLAADATFLDIQPYLCHCDLRMLWLQLHRPFLTRALVQPRCLANRFACIASARMILIMFRTIVETDIGKRLPELAYCALNALIVLVLVEITCVSVEDQVINRVVIERTMDCLRPLRIDDVCFQTVLTQLQHIMDLVISSEPPHVAQEGKRKRDALDEGTFRHGELARSMMWSFPTMAIKNNPEVKQDPDFLSRVRFNGPLPFPAPADPNVSHQCLLEIPDVSDLAWMWHVLRDHSAAFPLAPDLREWSALHKKLMGGIPEECARELAL